MDDKLAAAISTAPKQVLMTIVKLAQKQEMKGSKGGWKEFLNVHDRQAGANISDPGKRSRETLAAFLETFTRDEDLKFISNMLSVHSNREKVGQILGEESKDSESPEQRLIRATLQHPLYISSYAFPSDDEEWVVTKVRRKLKSGTSTQLLAVDCEMVLCEDGTDALIRVCVVDRDLQVKLDERVNPYKPVSDYRTEITGVTSKDFDSVSCSLKDVQKSVRKLFSKGTILVGHGLHNDLKALKVDHARVIDTSFIFKTSDRRQPSLSNLYKAVMGKKLRKEGAPHDCLKDACAAMELVLAKIKCGVDNDIPLIIQTDLNDVPETKMKELLIHRIPIDIPSEELHGIFPQNFGIELKPPKGQGVRYSAVAVFENPEEANQAFENVPGRIEKDPSGRPQKLITLELMSGRIVHLYVRKMGCDQVAVKKRAFEGDDLSDAKKLKIGQCDEHVKEIERLKQEIKEKDFNLCDNHLKEIEKLQQDLKAKDLQIAVQDKMITNLRKQLEEMKKNRKK